MEQNNASAYAEKKQKTRKPPLQKVSPFFVEEMAQVMAMGDEKYKDTPWRNGLPLSEVIGALKRHTSCIEKGEYIDQESGLSHLAHVAVNAMYLYHFLAGDYPSESDLPWAGTRPWAGVKA